ncbi:Protein MEMO1 [Grifola frondosa]|uniref:Protein MEMO1 n=1 Tax=Grifola frondosa TaxID=5627 RepID=A0A1C7MSD2_GRIFR|nr:Protein MEMO1 [Grifola frondosa]
MAERQATHADSWYNGDERTLDTELSSWLEGVKPGEEYAPPIKGCKAIIAPHAGYSYSGRAAAWAYKSIDTTRIKRVFILGPAHHVYLDGCALSKCGVYKTPIGQLPLDLDTIKELRDSGKFSDMSQQTDEDEHSIEMHLPYVRKIFQGVDIRIVPILVGAIDQDKEAAFGRILAPYLARDDTFCVISSDFCHCSAPAVRLSKSDPSAVVSTHPIHASISALDHEAMELLTVPPFTASQAHHNFAEYLARTKNTICGRHPIGVLLGALSNLEQQGRVPKVQWVWYEQSSQCVSIKDSSVSYASAFVKF